MINYKKYFYFFVQNIYIFETIYTSTINEFQEKFEDQQNNQKNKFDLDSYPDKIIYIDKKTFQQDIIIHSTKNKSPINNKAFFSYCTIYIGFDVIFYIVVISNIFQSLVTQNQNNTSPQKLHEKSKEFDIIILIILVVLLKIMFIYYKYIMYDKKKNQDNEIYIQNKSLYWNINKIYNSYFNIKNFLYKNINWIRLFLNVIINCCIGFGMYKFKDKIFSSDQNKIILYIFGLLNIYLILDLIISLTLYYFFDLDKIFINKIFAEELELLPNNDVILIRFYGSMNNDNNENWAENTIKVLNSLKESTSEESKYSVINNNYDDHFFYNEKIHDRMLIWLKK